MKGPLLKLRDQLQLREDLLLPGFVQYEQLPIYYGLARAFVLPSTFEPWGLAVNEAMASGLPVLISNRCGCARDLVQHGKNGFVFDPQEATALAHDLSRLSGGHCDLPAMSQASRQIVKGWSPENFAKNLVRALNAALRRPCSCGGPIDRTLLSLLLRRRGYE